MPMTHKSSIPVGVSSPIYGVTHKRVGVFLNSELNDVSSAKERTNNIANISTTS